MEYLLFLFFGLPLASTKEMTLHIRIWVPRFPCTIYKYIHCSFTSQHALPADLTGSLLNAKENTLSQQNSRANWTWTTRKSFSVSSGACQSTKCWWWLTRVAHLMQKLARVARHSAAEGASSIRDGEVEGCREPKALEMHGPSVWTSFWICSGGRRHQEKAWFWQSQQEKSWLK